MVDVALHAARRARLAERLGHGVALFGGASVAYRNADTEHLFRQDSDLLYLTGCEEPDVILVIDPGHDEHRSILFMPEPDPEVEAYVGKGLRPEAAVERYGVDAAHFLDELEAVVGDHLSAGPVLWWRRGQSAAVDRAAGNLVTRARNWQQLGIDPLRIEDPYPVLHDLRLRKDDADLDAMRRAGDISAEAHREAMRYAQPGLTERQVQAALEFVFRHRGGAREAYPSIVATGANACTLHYVRNDAVLTDGDLLLIDAGTELDGLASDITRTFPVNGRFSAAQRSLYEVVLAALEACTAAVGPGASLLELNLRAAAVLTEGLVELGILPGPVDRALEMHHYRAVYPHSLSHWLGRDVHDVGTQRVDARVGADGVGKPRPLEPGMVFTIEPGVYVDPDRPVLELDLLAYDAQAWRARRSLLGASRAKALEAEAREGVERIEHEIPSEFLGMGIRIEDDVVVTDDGVEVLTAGVPKAVAEIEALCAETPLLPRRL